MMAGVGGFHAWEGNQEQVGKGWVGDENQRIKMCPVHVPNPHSECNHYALQTWINQK